MDNYCMSVMSETQLRLDVGQCTIRCLDISSKYSLHGDGSIIGDWRTCGLYIEAQVVHDFYLLIEDHQDFLITERAGQLLS